MKMKGKLIVIEGTDGSGKETHSKFAFELLKKEGFAVELIEFPQYGKPSAAMVEEYLNGKLGSAEEVGPYRASILYAVDRYGKSRELWRWLKEGKIIICNRYMTANKGHQAGKLKSREEIDKFLAWLDELEYNIFKIPPPDKVIFLHMPAKIGQRLVGLKGERKYLNGKGKDLHEGDLKHLEDAEKAYLYVAKKEGWVVLELSDGENPCPIEKCQEMVYEAVKKAI